MSRAATCAVLLLALPGAGASALRAQTARIERTGDVVQIAIPAVALATTFARHDDEGTVQLAKAFVTNFAATEALKFAVGRERPDSSDHCSFPSGHTSTAFQAASFIQIRYGWAAGVPAYVGATFVGFSRVRARRHYTSDVVAGAVLGTASSLLFTHPFAGITVTPVAGAGRYGFRVRLDRAP